MSINFWQAYRLSWLVLFIRVRRCPGIQIKTVITTTVRHATSYIKSANYENNILHLPTELILTPLNLNFQNVIPP